MTVKEISELLSVCLLDTEKMNKKNSKFSLFKKE